MQAHKKCPNKYRLIIKLKLSNTDLRMKKNLIDTFFVHETFQFQIPLFCLFDLYKSIPSANAAPRLIKDKASSTNIHGLGSLKKKKRYKKVNRGSAINMGIKFVPSDTNF